MPKATRIEFAGRPRRDKKARIRAIILKWRERLNVAEWSFVVTFEKKSMPSDPGTAACIIPAERYSDARVQIFPEFWAEPRITQERTLVHELSHVPLNRVANLLERLKKLSDVATGDVIEDTFEKFTEHFSNVVWDAFNEPR